MQRPPDLTTPRASLEDVLDAAGLVYARRDETRVDVTARSEGVAGATTITFTDTPFELLLEAHAGTFAIDAPSLVYVNELNLWLPPGITAGADGTHAVLRGSLPITDGRTPSSDLVRALVATLHALRPTYEARRMPSDEEQRSLRVDDRPVSRGAALADVAAAFREVVALTPQPDGSFMAACRYERGSFLLRLSWSEQDGLCVDALGLGEQTFAFDATTLMTLASLNARLPVGGFALWTAGERGVLVYRRALPLVWLGSAAEPGVTLVSEDFVRSCLDNASGAWEAIEVSGLVGPARGQA